MGFSQKVTWAVSGFLFPHFLLANTEILAPEGTDLIEGTSFHKHDPKRPQPRKVITKQPVSIEAPQDATVIFNGKDLNNFQKGNSPIISKISKEGFINLGPGGLSTKQTFSDCQLHLEWRIPKENKIKGQKGSNSGILFLGYFEIQILESSNNPSYPDGQAGALYGEKPPLVNASSAQGEWQSYDIIFTAPKYKNKKQIAPARVTLIHNGVVVHHHEAFQNISSYRKHLPYPNFPLQEGPIQLKWDGDSVQFKNIWARELGQYDQKEVKKETVK